MRQVRISSVNFHKASTRGEGLQRAKGLIATALYSRPDLILLPECFANDIQTVEAVPGPITDEMAAIARENGCYIVVPLYQVVGNAIFNSSVLLGRDGGVCAVYHKAFPTDYEMKMGVMPGICVEAIATDFGRVGLAICFDLNFREVIDAYAASGTELILFSSAYEGGRQLAHLALEHAMYVVSSHWGGIGYFVDKAGHVLERGNSWRLPVVTRTINLDSYVFHTDYNYHSLDAIGREYGPKVHISADVPEGRFTMESMSDDVDILEIKRAYGLEFIHEYLDRSRRVRAQALSDPSRMGDHLRQGQP